MARCHIQIQKSGLEIIGRIFGGTVSVDQGYDIIANVL